ncbi:MAG TPA: alpha/beta hydrolase, partial [Polyangiaceae bacterium]
LKDAKRFAARIGSATAVTVDAVEEYVDRFLQERHADKFALNEQMMKSRDGFSVRIARNERAHNSQRETVVIINAIGMPIATLEKFIAKLSVAYDVLTWESRGVPSPDGTLDEQNARFARHIDDLEDMLATYRVARAHIVGWCTGGDVALEFLNRHPDRVISLVCMNSGFVGICSARVPFQESLAQIIRRVLRSPTYARLYFELMTKTRRGGLDRLAVDESLEASVEETMSHLDEDLMHLTGAPLQTPELFERYCRLLGYYFDEAPRCVPLSSVPVMIVTSEGDELVPYAASVAVAAAFRNSQIHFTTEGGHFAPCISEALAQDVTNFLLRNPVSGIERNESLVGGHENHCLEGVT